MDFAERTARVPPWPPGAKWINREYIVEGFFYVQKQIGLRLFPLGWFSCKTFWSQCIMIIHFHFSPCVFHTPTKKHEQRTHNDKTFTACRWKYTKFWRRTNTYIGTYCYLWYIWVKPFTESPLFVQETKLGRRSRPKWRLLLVTQGMR